MIHYAIDLKETLRTWTFGREIQTKEIKINNNQTLPPSALFKTSFSQVANVLSALFGCH